MNRYYVAFRTDKKMRCGCLTLVVRNEALAKKYPGGLKAYIQRASAVCNQDISISGYMGDDIDEDVRDLLNNGLKTGEDFTVIDVWDYEMRLMISADKKENQHKIDLRVDWLEAEHSKDGIDVWHRGR